jgi:hypothetical protein
LGLDADAWRRQGALLQLSLHDGLPSLDRPGCTSSREVHFARVGIVCAWLCAHSESARCEHL